jgi:Ni/Co efflux regulator RcnB
MQTNHMLALLFAGMLATGSALAEKPSWVGGEKSEKHEQKGKAGKSQGGDEPRERHASGQRVFTHFDDRRHAVIRDYYDSQFHQGRRCPPGLAKKHNGCMPPGQAKKWMLGAPLPRDVIFYDIPPMLARELGPPPAGHRYVRVAADILLIAIGTSMVVDAIEDLGRM